MLLILLFLFVDHPDFGRRPVAVMICDEITGYSKMFKLFKLIRIVLEDFGKKRMGFQCVALSYFCALAFIPLLAVIFAVTGGLGLADKVMIFLRNALAGNAELIRTLQQNLLYLHFFLPFPGWFSSVNHYNF